MKSFLTALVFICCAVSFSHADDGWATGYVQDYDELFAALQALKANVASASAKQAVQTIIDDLTIFLNFMKQRDGQQLPDSSWELANSIMFGLEPEMSGNPSFQEFLYSIGVQIKQLRRQQTPIDSYAEALNKAIVDFKNGVNAYLGGGC